LVFTPVVQALQEKYGSRRQYARMAAADTSPGRLGPDESAFLAERDSFYLATVGSTGWPYVQHRGGPKGFLKVIDDQTIACGSSPSTVTLHRFESGTTSRMATLTHDVRNAIHGLEVWPFGWRESRQQ